MFVCGGGGFVLWDDSIDLGSFDGLLVIIVVILSFENDVGVSDKFFIINNFFILVVEVKDVNGNF